MDLNLRQGEIVSLQGDARGMRLYCGEGLIWVTQPGDSRDYLLRAGKEFTVGMRGTIVVVALQEARVAALPRLQAGTGRAEWQLGRAWI